MTVPGSGQSRRERLKALREAALHRPVLARHLSDGFNGRWSRRQWATASLFASMGLLVAAIVPGFNHDVTASTPAAAHHSMALPLPPLPKRAPEEAQRDSWHMVSVQPGQTLGELFQGLGIPATTLQQILEQPSAQTALGRLKPGMELAFDLPVGGTLRTFRFDRDDLHRVELSFEEGRINETVIERPTQTRTTVATGEINSSLYAAARRAGLSPTEIAVLTDQIFQYDIDFNTDIQRGDRFSVVMDETWREGERIGRGTILAATFTTGGKTYSGFRFEHDDKAEYYTADGRPLKKSFIRMPIPYARLTSGFGARRHPVLGRVRQHKGVDYAARTGTPIMAAGDARVSFAGWRGGYGRAVILDHGRGHTTLYAHMSRFGKYKAGDRVPQGSVIGYVGTSGLSTGPHLHYEFRVNGVHRNPLSVTMPPPEPLKGEMLARFQAQAAPALARIEQVEKIHYAAANPGSDRRVATTEAPGTEPQG
ncbi:peptidoglycan DD-metalloendopeptidase family protein [Lysobacter sp. SG-8]|uniref:Peptidoglycan DD-metalloendopeptidase family protein n=1 Tax=Marilutibacter penaei TaxID=2759900 RepID=A0A7W3U4N0_9GAMM|nr:peptidoglycan DD-metalloendopeptidase family protein [Lysobacter penaei]MBB1088894.1 peptidoglycan DD-metalloendopeptidase family protein [Lysobacter penaei]